MNQSPFDFVMEDIEGDSASLTARPSEGVSSGPSSAMVEVEVEGPTTNSKLGTSRSTCQVEGCDRYPEKPYYRKHRICARHLKSPAIVIGGVGQRFCQKVSPLP